MVRIEKDQAMVQKALAAFGELDGITPIAKKGNYHAMLGKHKVLVSIQPILSDRNGWGFYIDVKAIKPFKYGTMAFTAGQIILTVDSSFDSGDYRKTQSLRAAGDWAIKMLDYQFKETFSDWQDLNNLIGKLDEVIYF